jgi:DNA helicase TIP49 (TBP-interacting protein)
MDTTCVVIVVVWLIVGLRIKEIKEVYEGEVTELTPIETEDFVRDSCCVHILIIVLILTCMRTY